MNNFDEYLESIAKYKKKWNIILIFKFACTFICASLVYLISLYNDIIFEVIGKNVFFILCIIGFVLWVILIILNYKMHLTDPDIVYLLVGDGKKNKEFRDLFRSIDKTEDDGAIKRHKFSKGGSIIRLYASFMDYYMIVLVALLSVSLIFTFILFPATVSQTSMEETLLEGDRVVVINKKSAEHGDIIVFKYNTSIQNKNACPDGELLVKRVIAKEGDIVSCNDGVFRINGQELSEEYVLEKNFKYASFTLLQVIFKNENREEISSLMENEITIPKGYYLVMGDNRDDSNDSEEFGLVYYKQIIGVVKYYKNSYGWHKMK